jgi:hypothetical protein
MDPLYDAGSIWPANAFEVNAVHAIKILLTSTLTGCSELCAYVALTSHDKSLFRFYSHVY